MIFKRSQPSKWVRIRPKYSATVVFSFREDKDGTNKHVQKIT